MSLKDKSIRGFFWTFAESFGLRMFTVLSYFFLAGILDAKSFGLVALANTFIQFTNIFVEQGFATALVQRRQVDDRHLDSCFWVNTLIGVAFFALAYGFAGFFAGVFRSPELEDVLRTLAVLFLISSVGRIHQSVLQRNFRFKAIATANLAGVFSGGILGVGLALNGFGVWSLVYQQITAALLTNLIFVARSGWRPRFRFSAPHFLEIFGFGYKMILNNLLYYLNRYTVDLLIGYFFDARTLGYYSFAYKIYNTVTDLVLLSVAKVTLPLFSSLQADPPRFRLTFLTVNKLNGYVSLAAFSAMAFIVPDAVVLFFGDKWLPSIPLIRILSLGGGFLFVYWLTDQALISLGRMRESIGLNLCSGLLSVVVIYSLIRLGVNAVAFTYLLRGALLLPLLLLLIRSTVGIHPLAYVRNLLGPYAAFATAGLVLAGLTFLLAGHPLAGIPVKGAALLGTCLAVVYGLEPQLWKTLTGVLFRGAPPRGARPEVEGKEDRTETSAGPAPGLERTIEQ